MEYPLTFEEFQQGLEEGKLWGLYCQSCGAYTVPPQGVCRNCQGQQLTKTEIMGEGVIRTFTVVRVAPEGLQPPYIVVLVELNQGPWVMGNLLGVDPEKMEIGLIGRTVYREPNSGLTPFLKGDNQALLFKLKD